ncbi:MAG TPA: ATP-binding protein, partial [Casimicrobiaceae bacterium]
MPTTTSSSRSARASCWRASPHDSSSAATRAERAGLASLFAQTPVPTAVLRGPDLVFDLANDAYRAMVGGRDVQGKALLDTLPEMREFATLLQAVMQTGRPHVGHEVPLRLDAGNSAPEAYFSYMFAPLRDERGGVEGVIALWNEVTEQVRARESLRDADRRKDEFLAILSHELRNPLAPLRNSLHLLRMKAQLEESRDAGRAPIYETMERQVNHLVRLVDDLMEMSRINRGTFELRRERVDVASVLRSAVEATEPLIAAAGHRLTVSLPDTPAIVDGDPVRLAQVVANLLSNAAKYTEGNGRIWLAAARDGNAVSITVRDNGAGIAPSTMPKLFEMFSRGDRMAHHKQEGLGIGLALARRLAEMHGGTVNGRSEGLGMGSEFTVRLPEAPASAASTAVADAEASVRAARVLVVDDNEDAADSMAEILRLLGADVTVVYDGGAALDAWKAHSPSVVLLDIGMPGMDGYEVARRIRDGSPRNGTWLVALTGWGQEDDRRRASEAGFDHHLVKPVDIAVLQDLL